MKIILWPQNIFGKTASILAITFIVTMFIKIMIKFFLPSLFIALIGFIGFIFSIISIVKYKDRSILTFIAFLLGLLIVFWTSAELLFPH